MCSDSFHKKLRDGNTAMGSEGENVAIDDLGTENRGLRRDREWFRCGWVEGHYEKG